MEHIRICILVKPSNSKIRRNSTPTSANLGLCRQNEGEKNLSHFFPSFYFILDIDRLQLLIFMDYKMILNVCKAECVNKAS